MTPIAVDSTLEEVLRGSPYVGYSYSYPHKTAYRDLTPAIDLTSLWSAEDRTALFLYLHIPFCEFRCGFCNLFTLSQPQERMVSRYLAALRRQAYAVRDTLGDCAFARLALGGGTPTFLHEQEIVEVFDVITSIMGVEPGQIPVGIEASPATVSKEKLTLLREYGVDRISLGVQSFDDAEAGAMGRPQKRADVERALEQIRLADFPVLNIDLIYGGEQSIEQWLRSLEAALQWRPEELYLYPLYVRPLTGLGRLARDWDDHRLAAYRAAREVLLSRGYEQLSMRMFRASHADEITGPVYCCQADGMIGLGCGARSYTTRFHYADRYAVRQNGIAKVIDQYVAKDASSFATANYGFHVDDEDRRRRYVILTLLQAAGIDREDYRCHFHTDVLGDFPQLGQLEQVELATATDAGVTLTPAGLERSDAIGPWLYSHKVRQRMEAYQWA